MEEKLALIPEDASIITEIAELEPDYVVVRAEVVRGDQKIISHGMAIKSDGERLVEIAEKRAILRLAKLLELWQNGHNGKNQVRNTPQNILKTQNMPPTKDTLTILHMLISSINDKLLNSGDKELELTDLCQKLLRKDKIETELDAKTVIEYLNHKLDEISEDELENTNEESGGYV
jgi:hypothetical protein